MMGMVKMIIVPKDMVLVLLVLQNLTHQPKTC